MKIAAVVATIVGCLFTINLNASTITFSTPTGSTVNGQPVNATATFTTNANGTVSISLADLLANPTDVGQLISDLEFTLSGGQTSGTLASSSGTQITVNGNGTSTLGSTGSTGWGLNNNVAGGLQLDALGFIGPQGLILGPPGPGGIYTNANGSIAGSPSHNPFINQTAMFIVNVTGVTASTTVTSATFSFGTTPNAPGTTVPGVPPSGNPVPEPGTVFLLGSGLLGLKLFRRKLS